MGRGNRDLDRRTHGLRPGRGLSVGIVGGWRWLFWLILIAFLAGILRVPAAALELAGKIPQQGPAWYVVLTALVGMIQFVVALAMAAGYRRSGAWGQ